MKRNLLFIFITIIILCGLTPLSNAEERSVNSFKHGNYTDAGSVKGGKIADGLDVKNIRWADRSDFERLVFDIYKWGGPTNPEGIVPNEYCGTFKFEFISPTIVEVSFEGYRAFTADFPKFTKSKLISEMQFVIDEESQGDSEYKIKIVFKKPAKIEIFELNSPARIVVDIIENK